MTSESATPAGPSKLPLICVGAAAALAALVVVALLTFRGPVTHEPGTPEATLQGFMEAVLDGDEDTAIEHMTTNAGNACRNYFRSDSHSSLIRQSDLNIHLKEMTVVGNQADATVLIRVVDSDSPFDSPRYTLDGAYSLVREDSSWGVEIADWPREFAACTDNGR